MSDALLLPRKQVTDEEREAFRKAQRTLIASASAEEVEPYSATLPSKPGRCRICRRKTTVFLYSRACGECVRPHDLSGCFCVGCATLYWLMNRRGHASRDGHLRLNECSFCKEREELIRPPNVTHTRFLHGWIERMFSWHKIRCRKKRTAKAPSVIILAVYPDGRMAAQSAPGWLGLAEGDIFRKKSDPRIVQHEARLIVPGYLAGRNGSS